MLLDSVQCAGARCSAFVERGLGFQGVRGLVRPLLGCGGMIILVILMYRGSGLLSGQPLEGGDTLIAWGVAERNPR